MKKGPYVEYSSNNSGGSWWLSDEDWQTLAQVGWEVEWGGLFFCHSSYSMHKPPAGVKQPCSKGADCQGHRRYATKAAAVKAKARDLGALARSATRRGLPLREAIEEWEAATGKRASALGCSCCGAPHSFTEYGADGSSVGYYSPAAPMFGSEW